MTVSRLFSEKCIIGMVHCLPLPGTARYAGNMKDVTERALQDARTLRDAGVSALIVENMNDDPVGTRLAPEQFAALAAVSALVRKEVEIPVGIDAYFCDWEASLTIAVAVGADFIRVPVFIDTVLTSDGIVYPCARQLLCKRKQLDAEKILLLCDIQVKHSYMLLDSISLEDSAKMAEENGADAIVVTGAHTGAAAPIDALRSVRKIVKLPLLVGSGFNVSNAAEQLCEADGAIVGSAFKRNGVISAPVDYELVRAVMKAVNG